MVKEKYPDLDFSDMKGHEENPPVSVNAAPVQHVVPVLDRQFVLKSNMAVVFSDLIDLSIKVIIV